MRNILRVEADIKGQRRVPAYTVTQNDSVSIVITVLDGGSPVNLDEVTTITLACTRRDGLVVVKDGTQTGPNEVTFDLGTSEIEQTGKVDAVIQLYSADSRVSTIKFSFMVTKDPTGEGYVPSEDERTLIEVVLGDGPLVIERAEMAAASAEGATAYIDEKKPLIDKFTDEQTSLQAQLDEVARGATNVETSQARVSTTGTAYGTLKERLDSEYEEVTSQLAQTPKKTEVYLRQNGININDLDEETRQAVLENNNIDINYVLGERNVKRENLDFRSVTPDRTTFMSKSRNLFDGEYKKIHLIYRSYTGVMEYLSHHTLGRTAIIRLEPNETYTVKIHDPDLNDVFRMAVVNSEVDYNAVEWTSTDRLILNNTLTTKEHTFTNDGEGKYLLINVSDAENEPRLQVEKGDNATNYVSPYVVDEDIISEEIIKKTNEWRQLQEVVYIENLFKSYLDNTTLSSSAGLPIPNENIVASDEFIEINNDVPYTVGLTQLKDSSELSNYKIVYYDKNKSYINTTDWISGKNEQYKTITIPNNAVFIKAAVNKGYKDLFFINIGEVPYFSTESDILSSGFSKIIPEKVVEKKHLSSGVLNLMGIKDDLKPFPKRLRWDTIIESGSIKVFSMSQDGKVIYAGRGYRVSQSLDEGETWQDLFSTNPASNTVDAVRCLNDGELLFSTVRNDANNVHSKLFKTIGYDRNSPSNTQVHEVLETINFKTNFNNRWCLDVHDNIVIASEYGLRVPDGSQYVFLSTDYGDTWETIFDQRETTKNIVGAAPYTNDAHVHTAHYDRYGERIWVVCGDVNSTGTYYSDDLGVTWKVAKESTGIDAMQYTGIISYPEGVFFGSDREPHGVYFWERTNNKSDDVYIKPYLLTPFAGVSKLVYEFPFRRYSEKDEVTFFSANSELVENGLSGIIVGLKGTKGISILSDLSSDFPTTNGVTACVGETAEGNVIASIKVGNDYKVIRAKTPMWE